MTALLRAALGPALAATAATAAWPALGAPEPGERVTRSAEGYATEHTLDTLRDPLALREKRTPAEALVRQPKSGSTLSAALSGTPADAWIYDAPVSLFYDYDGDGYYRYLRVRFDADTVYTSMYVYAALFLSADGVTWEEYHVTDDFLIRGSSPGDDYEVETELLVGYPPGEYDLLIELYDADYSVLVDEYGPFESASFELLPLEDAEHDGVRYVESHGGGGGAAGWPFLVLLGGAAALARRSRRGA